MSWLTSVLGSLTPTEISALGSGLSQASQTQEMQLLQSMIDNPPQAASFLATLQGIRGVPPAVINYASAAVAAMTAGDKTSFTGNMVNAKNAVLTQQSGLSSIL